MIRITLMAVVMMCCAVDVFATGGMSSVVANKKKKKTKKVSKPVVVQTREQNERQHLAKLRNWAREMLKEERAAVAREKALAAWRERCRGPKPTTDRPGSVTALESFLETYSGMLDMDLSIFANTSRGAKREPNTKFEIDLDIYLNEDPPFDRE